LPRSTRTGVQLRTRESEGVTRSVGNGKRPLRGRLRRGLMPTPQDRTHLPLTTWKKDSKKPGLGLSRFLLRRNHRRGHCRLRWRRLAEILGVDAVVRGLAAALPDMRSNLPQRSEGHMSLHARKSIRVRESDRAGCGQDGR